MARGKYWNEEAETLSPRALERLRIERLRRQLTWAASRSSVYVEKFRAAGLGPEGVRSVEQFRHLPVFMDKDQHRESQEDSLKREGHPFGTFLCVKPRQLTGVYATSGTTGEPTFYVFTRRDRRIHNELLKRAFWRMGLRPGDCLLWGFGLGMWIGASFIPALSDFGVRVIAVGAEAGSERLLRMARLIRPDALLATPSYLEYLIERAPHIIGVGVDQLGLKRIITGGEPGAGLEAVRSRVMEAFGAPLYDMSGPAYQFSFVSCGSREYGGLHAVGQDYGIVEDLVNPHTGEPVQIRDGAFGSMTLTELDKQAAPAIRYAYGDVLELRIGECGCGFKGLSIFIRGRVDDMLIVKGVNVFPAAIKNLVGEFMSEVTGALRIDLDEPPPRVKPPLRIRVEHSLGLDEDAIHNLRDRIREKMRARLNVSPEINMVPAGSLGRSMRKTSLIEVHGAKTN